MKMRRWTRTERRIGCALIGILTAGDVPTLDAQVPARVTQRGGDSVMVRLLDVDLRAAIQALTPFLDKPIVVGALPGNRVTIETPTPVARSGLRGLLQQLLESQGLTLTLDSAGTVYRVSPREVASRPPPAIVPTVQGSQATELFVIRLRHARASEVAETVNALYGRTSAFGVVSDRPSTLARDLMTQTSPPPGAPSAGVPARTASFAGETTIVPDQRANSLLVRANRADFELIQAAVTQLDVRPLQVLIEVLIVEVRRDRAAELGVETTLPTTTVPGSANTTVEGQIKSDAGLGDLAIKIMGIGSRNVGATIRAAESRGDARILSRPVLLAANNERAEINVGSQRPFVQVARVLPTDNTARDQVVQYKDVGTRLSVVPTISFEGYVMLQIVQEINAATEEQQFNAPVISTRSVETRLLVRDSQTIVLGGLSDVQRETIKRGVPLLSRLPILGALFGSQRRRRAETELLLFLTPRLVRSDEDADALTDPLRKRATGIRP
jgi:general secretion pathway protein D